MLFNSSVFLIFAIIFFSIWTLVRKKKQIKWIFITIASFVFYGWWDWRFLFLLIGSGLIDYIAAIAMEKRAKHKKAFLFLSLFGNVGSLAVFKYSGFFADNLSEILSLFNVQVDLKQHIPQFALILPVGISFYTFQSLNYIIDVYFDRLKPTKNVFHFYSYLTLFPHLVAGPILRATILLPQLEKYTSIKEEDIWFGTKCIVTGFFYKIVIADNIAQTVNFAFSSPDFNNSSLYWWYIITLFAFQIYFDFNGYSKIAIGLLKWMGYSIPNNFNHPYLSISMKEFWKRRHISLSSWMRDYIYIPFSNLLSEKIKTEKYFGIKKEKFIYALSIFLTFSISGFWHGAAWNFIIWGVLLAFLIIFERFFIFPFNLQKYKIVNVFTWFLVIVQIWVTWVFFRAGSFDQAINIIKTMFSFTGSWSINLSFDEIIFLILAIIPEAAYFIYSKLNINKLSTQVRISEVLIMPVLIIMCIFLRGPGANFIYFQF